MRFHLNAWRGVAVFSALFLTFALLLTAGDQTPAPGTGSIAGTVKSSAGKPVGGATVITFNLDTGDTAQAETDSNGNYRVAGLSKGDYELSVACDGFDLYSSSEIKVEKDKAVRHDVKLDEAPATAKR